MKKTFNMGLFTFFKNLFSSSEVAPPSRYTHTICNPDCNFDIELLSDEIIIKDETDYDTISVSGGDLLEVAISSPIRLKIKSKRVSTIDNTYRKVRASVLKSDLTDLQIDAIFNGNYSLFPTSSIMYYENETKNLFRLAEVPFSDSEF